MTSVSAGSSLTPRAVCPVSRHSTDIDMLVRSFDQIVSLISATSGDSIAASFSAARSRAIRSLCAIVAFADQEPVAVRREVRDHAGRDHFIGRKDHAADDALLRDRGAQPPPGSRKPRSGVGGWFAARPISYHQGMPFCAKTTAVSSPSSGFRPVARAATPGRLQRRDHDILRPERRRIVGRLDIGLELGAADPQGQAVVP